MDERVARLESALTVMVQCEANYEVRNGTRETPGSHAAIMEHLRGVTSAAELPWPRRKIVQIPGGGVARMEDGTDAARYTQEEKDDFARAKLTLVNYWSTMKDEPLWLARTHWLNNGWVELKFHVTLDVVGMVGWIRGKDNLFREHNTDVKIKMKAVASRGATGKKGSGKKGAAGGGGKGGGKKGAKGKGKNHNNNNQGKGGKNNGNNVNNNGKGQQPPPAYDGGW
eukprot:gene262-428_t